MSDDLLLYGPPGTGKTYSGLAWMEDRIEEGADLQRAAFVSYTTAAVNVARDRIAQRFDIDPNELPYTRTLHALCKRALGISERDWLADTHLEEFAAEFGFDIKAARSRRPEDDLADLTERSGRDAACLRIWDFGRQRLLNDPAAAWMAFTAYSPEDAAFVDYSRFLRCVQQYEAWKQRQGWRDYTDLLTEVVRHPVHLPVSVAVIDEAQDLSPLMWSVSDVFFANAEYRATLGDDDQCVYSFNGAAPELMNRRSCARKVKLRQSYRLPRQVAANALKVIAPNRDREPKEILPRDMEGTAERRAFQDLDLLSGESWLVTIRNWRIKDQMIPLFVHAGIPYRFGGNRRYSPWSDRGPLKAVRAILRLSRGQEVSMTDLMPLVDRTSTERGEKPGTWTWGAKKKIRDLSAERGSQTATWRDLLDLGMTTAGLKQIVSCDFGILSREISANDLETFRWALKRGTLERNVCVTVASGHGAKGQEFDCVAAIMACTAGPARNLVRRQRIEEERRVAYVMATRARNRFYGVPTSLEQGVHPYNILGV